ncbi:hypothetical protein FKM82_029681 [Ascaphus truei]
MPMLFPLGFLRGSFTDNSVSGFLLLSPFQAALFFYHIWLYCVIHCFCKKKTQSFETYVISGSFSTELESDQSYSKAMREYNPHSGYTLNEVLLNPVMLQRAKYSRFRNDSLTPTEEGTQSVSLNGKGSSKSHAPAAVPSVPIENITVVTQDSPKPFCTLIPKMSHFKLSNPASLLGLKHFSLGTRELPKIKLAGGHTAPAPAETTLNSYLTAAHVRQGGEVKKEPGGDGVLLEIDTPTTALTKDSHAQHVGHCSVRTGPSYSVKYMGCIEVLQSMRSLDFGMRTQVTREAISRLCEAVPGAKGAGRKRKVRQLPNDQLWDTRCLGNGSQIMSRIGVFDIVLFGGIHKLKICIRLLCVRL